VLEYRKRSEAMGGVAGQRDVLENNSCNTLPLVSQYHLETDKSPSSVTAEQAIESRAHSYSRAWE
jgi:hypothetical protein